MLKIIGETAGNVLLVKASGVMHASDYLENTLEIKSRVTEIQPRGLLLDWTELEGWDDESESLRFFVRLELRSSLKRVAVLADEDWDAEVRRLQEVTDLPIRCFPPSDRQLALDWLDSDS